MLRIENESLLVTINPLGAELTSILYKHSNIQHLWEGNPAYWGKHSPVLFPIVGALKQNKYLFEGAEYSLPRHGFAREKEFTVEEQESDYLTMILKADEETLKTYPFQFEFRIRYSLEIDSIIVGYEVRNSTDKEMFFSVGGHPAFKVPFIEGTDYADYFLEFSEIETQGRWPVTPEGLIAGSPEPLLNNSSRLNLTKELFNKDALVFKNLASSSLTLATSKSDHGLRFNFTDFPFLGIWATKGGDFVCIEPWCGIADNVNTNSDFRQKEGINLLAPGDHFKRSWSVEFF